MREWIYDSTGVPCMLDESHVSREIPGDGLVGLVAVHGVLVVCVKLAFCV